MTGAIADAVGGLVGTIVFVGSGNGVAAGAAGELAGLAVFVGGIERTADGDVLVDKGAFLAQPTAPAVKVIRPQTRSR